MILSRASCYFRASGSVRRHCPLPLLLLPLSLRGTWGTPPLYPTYQTSGAGGGGVVLYPLLGVRHAEQCRRIWFSEGSQRRFRYGESLTPPSALWFRVVAASPLGNFGIEGIQRTTSQDRRPFWKKFLFGMMLGATGALRRETCKQRRSRRSCKWPPARSGAVRRPGAFCAHQGWKGGEIQSLDETDRVALPPSIIVTAIAFMGGHLADQVALDGTPLTGRVVSI